VYCLTIIGKFQDIYVEIRRSTPPSHQLCKADLTADDGVVGYFACLII